MSTRRRPAVRWAGWLAAVAVWVFSAPLSADKAQRPPRAGVQLTAALLVPSGRPDVSAFTPALLPDAGRSAAFALHLGGRYQLPVLDRALAGVLEIGWHRLSDQARRENPSDPDFSDVTYRWTMDALPVHVGLAYRLPVRLPAQVVLGVSGGFSMAWVWATTTYEAAGAPAVQDATQHNIGFGFFLGADGGVRLGPGRALLEVRYVNIRTDLGLSAAYPNQPYNAELGDIAGTELLLGYRLEL